MLLSSNHPGTTTRPTAAQKDIGYNLHQRAHNLTLPSDVSLTAKQNFIPGMLFADMYWSILAVFYIAFISL